MKKLMSFLVSSFFGTLGVVSYVVLPFLPVILLGVIAGVLGFILGKNLLIVGVIMAGITILLLSAILSHIFKDKLIVDWSGHGGFMPGPSGEFDGGDIWQLGIACTIGIALGYGWGEGMIQAFLFSIGDMCRAMLNMAHDFWGAMWR